MKTVLSFLALFVMFILTSCSDNPASGPANGGGGLGGGIIGGGGPGGGGNNGNVTITAGLAQDEQQQYYFSFTPNSASVISKVTAVCQQANVNESVDVPAGEIYSNNNPLYIGPVTVLQAGQQWKFTIVGKEGNAQGKAFTSTANFTVQ